MMYYYEIIRRQVEKKKTSKNYGSLVYYEIHLMLLFDLKI